MVMALNRYLAKVTSMLRGSIDNGSVSGPYTVSLTDIGTTATVLIDDAAILGQDILTWKPAANTGGVGVFKTPRMRKVIVDTTNGSIEGIDHPIAGFDYIEFKGTGTVDFAFGHESKIKASDAGNINNFSFYKPSRDSLGSKNFGNLVLFDADLDLTGSGATVANAYIIRNEAFRDGVYTGKDFLTVNAGRYTRAQTGNEVLSSVWPSIAEGRFYFPRGWGSANTAAITKDLLIATPPIVIPERTTFTKIGIYVATGVASSVARFGIYKMGANGLPTEKVYGSAAIATTANGVVAEETMSVTLEAGAYHLAYQNTGGASGATVATIAFTSAYLAEIYGLSSANTSTPAEDWMYISNTGVLPDTFGTPTRLLVGAVPAVYLKK